MGTLLVQGQAQDVEKFTKMLARSLFLSGFESIGFVEDGVGCVKFDKIKIYSMDRSSPDGIIILDNFKQTYIPKDVGKCTILVNAEDKIPFLKKISGRSYAIKADEQYGPKNSLIVMLGATVKVFERISLKSAKLVTEGFGKHTADMIDFGNKNVKQMR